VTGWWFSSGTPVSSTNKTDRHDIAEILFKVALNTINHLFLLTYLQSILVDLYIELLLELEIHLVDRQRLAVK
jgi:hypothetical protein